MMQKTTDKIPTDFTMTEASGTLEQAAEEYAFGNLDDAALYGCTISGRIAAFKAGAKWQQKQGAKGYVLESASPVCKEDKPQRLITIRYDETEDNYVRRGDDIIIQIKKL